MNRKTILLFLLSALLLASCGRLLKKRSTADEVAEEPCQLKIGLVLGGGGAKAAAEIGVLKVIDSLGIKVSSIAGSSMGSVVGGLYASGYTAKEIETIFLKEDWISLFDRDVMGQADGRFLGRIDGDVFEERLYETLKCSSFEDTKIEFRCTATEIIEQKYLVPRVLSEGPMLAKAIHASMAWPAPIVGYKAVDYEGMSLVDGGMLNNLPVDVIIDDVDVVIAVDLEQRSHNDKDSYLQPFGLNMEGNWLTKWLRKHPDVNSRNRNIELAKREDNIYIKPDLGGYSILSFSKRDMREMIAFGELAAKKHIERLRLLK